MLIVFIIFLFLLFLGVYKIVELIIQDKKLKEKSKAIDNFYQYLENREYRTFVNADSLEGLYAGIQKYKDKEDTKYVEVNFITYSEDCNLYSALLTITRDVEKS